LVVGYVISTERRHRGVTIAWCRY